MLPADLLRQTREHLAGVDIYLLDLILTGMLKPPARILDAGCGAGRNLRVLQNLGFETVGMDNSWSVLNSSHPDSNRRRRPKLAAGDLVDLPLRDVSFDAVVANAVLHFAANPAAFERMLQELWRVLRPGGLFFARLALRDGIENATSDLGNGRYRLPDGSDRYLVGLDELDERTRALGALPVTPLKTSLVHGKRSMGTWCIRKP